MKGEWRQLENHKWEIETGFNDITKAMSQLPLELGFSESMGLHELFLLLITCE